MKTAKKSQFAYGTKVETMLLSKSFDKLLEDGDIFDTEGAAQKSGYTVHHVRRLCRERKIGHFTRTPEGNSTPVCFFLWWQLADLFELRNAEVKP